MSSTKRKLQSCNACSEYDEYDDMVCCDLCDGWYHFICVGVSPEIKVLDWYCQFCLSAEKKVVKSKIKTIPDLWMRGKNAEKYFVCPTSLTDKSFEKAVLLRFEPTSNWEKIRCSILQSKFTTYQLAKAAEDSILRNLQTKKIRIERRKEIDNKDDIVEEKELEEVSKKVKSCAITQVSNNVELPAVTQVPVCVDLSTVVEGNVESRPSNCEAVISEGSDFVNLSRAVQHVLEESAISELFPVVKLPSGVKQSTQSKSTGFEEPICDDVALCTASKHLIPFNEELIKNFDDFDRKFRELGGSKYLSRTMRAVSNKIVSDDLLQDYSLQGRRRKLPFNQYPNIIKLIVSSTTYAFNTYNAQEQGFIPKTENEVRDYFENNFIKSAKQRSEQK